MKNAFDILKSRGFLEQATDFEMVKELLKTPCTCYIGFDPTAKSLHAGSLLPIMSLVHMQKTEHRPIVLVGGGTALIGDPSGKTESRPIMTREEINNNGEAIKKQLSRFIDFSDGKALMVNNADWLSDLTYINFLRDIGRHFSVNRMLTAESYRARMATGLNFIEFNYMLLQAYDFWYLFKQHGCQIQMGGNDQWGNILAGADLVRRLESKIVHGLTFPLLTTSSGMKMGKTNKGAVWLDPDLTSPYDYYQYWINQDDRDIKRLLALFTLLPLEEIDRLGSLEGADIREAKEILAFETTRLCHGIIDAENARTQSRMLFGTPLDITPENLQDEKGSGPEYKIGFEELEQGIPAFILYEKAGLCKSRGDARRLISQGGGYLNHVKLHSFDQLITREDFVNDSLLLRAGKKKYMRITFD